MCWPYVFLTLQNPRPKTTALVLSDSSAWLSKAIYKLPLVLNCTRSLSHGWRSGGVAPPNSNLTVLDRPSLYMVRGENLTEMVYRNRKINFMQTLYAPSAQNGRIMRGRVQTYVRIVAWKGTISAFTLLSEVTITHFSLLFHNHCLQLIVNKPTEKHINVISFVF